MNLLQVVQKSPWGNSILASKNVGILNQLLAKSEAIAVRPVRAVDGETEQQFADRLSAVVLPPRDCSNTKLRKFEYVNALVGDSVVNRQEAEIEVTRTIEPAKFKTVAAEFTLNALGVFAPDALTTPEDKLAFYNSVMDVVLIKMLDYVKDPKAKCKQDKFLRLTQKLRYNIYGYKSYWYLAFRGIYNFLYTSLSQDKMAGLDVRISGALPPEPVVRVVYQKGNGDETTELNLGELEYTL